LPFLKTSEKGSGQAGRIIFNYFLAIEGKKENPRLKKIHPTKYDYCV